MTLAMCPMSSHFTAKPVEVARQRPYGCAEGGIDLQRKHATS
jgi:hypothetical protein